MDERVDRSDPRLAPDPVTRATPVVRRARSGSRILIGEIWLPDVDRFARYLRPDEMHTAFNFEFLACPWDATRLRDCIDATLAAHAPVGAPATWVLSNHDVTRHVTRYGREDTAFEFAAKTRLAPATGLLKQLVWDCTIARQCSTNF